MLSDNKISRDDALQILDDLDWHHRSEFFHLADHIPPEIASRAYVLAVPEKSRPKRKSQEPHIQTKYGRRRVVDSFLKHLRHAGVVESRGQRENREFRLVDVNGDSRFTPLLCPCCAEPDPYAGPSGAHNAKVECRECGLSVERETKLQAIRAWNQRLTFETTGDSAVPRAIEDTTGRQLHSEPACEHGAGI